MTGLYASLTRWLIDSYRVGGKFDGNDSIAGYLNDV